jgi:hypothetical protein
MVNIKLRCRTSEPPATSVKRTDSPNRQTPFLLLPSRSGGSAGRFRKVTNSRTESPSDARPPDSSNAESQLALARPGGSSPHRKCPCGAHTRINELSEFVALPVNAPRRQLAVSAQPSSREYGHSADTQAKRAKPPVQRLTRSDAHSNDIDYSQLFSPRLFTVNVPVPS